MMKTNNWLLTFGIAAGSILLEICLMPLRGWNLKISGIAALILFTIYTCVCLYKIKNISPYFTVISISVGLLAIHLPLRVPFWQDSLITLPDAIMHFIGVGMGCLFWYGKTPLKIVTVGLSSIICIGYVYGFQLYLNKLSYGTFTGTISEAVMAPSPKFYDNNGTTLGLENFTEDYLVMDFWYSGCGGCYKKFPLVEKLYASYQADEKVGVYSVFCRLENETVTTGNEILSQRGYTFPNICIDMSDPILKELGVELFPTVLIFDKERSLVFRGNIESAGKFIVEKLSKDK